MTAPEVITAPTELPVSAARVKAFTPTKVADSALEPLIRAVTDEVERNVLWRAVVAQRRRVFLRCPGREIEIEPFRNTTAAGSSSPPTVQLYDEFNMATAVDASLYYQVPAEGIIALRRGKMWPKAERNVAPFSVSYWAGWDVADIPSAITQMIIRAVVDQYAYRTTLSGKAPGVEIPRSIAAIGMGYSLRHVVSG